MSDAGRTRGDDLLGRWSRRKRAAAQGEPLPEDPVEEGGAAESGERSGESESTSERIPFEERTDPRTGKKMKDLTDQDMPPLEELTPDSDLTVFRGGQVSAELRRAARKLVYHSAKFNRLDTANDSIGDFTNFAPLGDRATHFSTWHAVRKARDAARDAVDRFSTSSSGTESATEGTESPTVGGESPRENEARESGATEDGWVSERPEAGGTGSTGQPVEDGSTSRARAPEGGGPGTGDAGPDEKKT